MTTSAQRSSASWPQRIERVALAAVAGVVLLQLAFALCDGLFSLWSGSRLAFAAAVARGLDVYPTARAGAVTGNMYGPFMAPFYLPALLAPGVTAKILVAEAMTAAAMILPVGLLLARELPPRGVSTTGVATALVAIVATLTAFMSTSYELTSIHADGPCLGLGMASYLVLSRSTRPSALRLATAAILVALATLTKPQGAFVAAGEALLLLHSAGWRSAARFASACAAALVGLGTLLVLATHTTFAGLWFNAIVIPSQQVAEHGLLEQGLDDMRRDVLSTTLELFRPLAGCMLLSVVAAWLLRRAARAASGTTPSLRVPAGLWLLALVLAPISVAARMKIGGDVNSFHAHYYGIVAALFLGAEALATLAPSALRVLFLAGLAASLSPLTTLRALRELPPLRENPHELATAYLRQHDDAYFPWHSLSTLEARGELLHHADGVHSRALAGVPVTKAYFLRHAPAAPAYVMMPPVGRLAPNWVYWELVSRYYPGYMPDAGPPPELAALGVQVFRRP